MILHYRISVCCCCKNVWEKLHNPIILIEQILDFLNPYMHSTFKGRRKKRLRNKFISFQKPVKGRKFCHLPLHIYAD